MWLIASPFAWISAVNGCALKRTHRRFGPQSSAYAGARGADGQRVRHGRPRGKGEGTARPSQQRAKAGGRSGQRRQVVRRRLPFAPAGGTLVEPDAPNGPSESIRMLVAFSVSHVSVISASQGVGPARPRAPADRLRRGTVWVCTTAKLGQAQRLRAARPKT